jgi:hypothetical protein
LPFSGRSADGTIAGCSTLGCFDDCSTTGRSSGKSLEEGLFSFAKASVGGVNSTMGFVTGGNVSAVEVIETMGAGWDTSAIRDARSEEVVLSSATL